MDGWLPPEPPDDLPPTTAGRLADLEAEQAWRARRAGLRPIERQAERPGNERPRRPDDAPPPDVVYLVWPENWPAVALWLELGTQWRLAGEMGVRAGLDYAAVWAHLDRVVEDPKERRERMADLRLMERAAIEEIAADLEWEREERERQQKLADAARRGG